jgi:cbb3-type cytochrome oxidase maturation protein
MNIFLLLAPFSVLLGLTGLVAFWWTLRARQYEDPQGDASRILDDHLCEGPDDEAGQA